MTIDNDELPTPYSRYGKTLETLPGAIFFVTSVTTLAGSPNKRRDTRVWGWFPSLDEAVAVVRGNRSDLEERCYDYVMVEAITSGISVSETIEWWWSWNEEDSRWVPSTRPCDLEHALGLTIG